MDTRPGSDLLGQDRLGSPSCTTLLSLRDWRGAALCASVDGSLLFQAPGQDGQCYQGSGAGVWLLAAAGGAPTSGGSSYSLQHAASRRFLAAAGGRLVLSDAPQQLQLFMDMERSECGLGQISAPLFCPYHGSNVAAGWQSAAPAMPARVCNHTRTLLTTLSSPAQCPQAWYSPSPARHASNRARAVQPWPAPCP